MFRHIKHQDGHILQGDDLKFMYYGVAIFVRSFSNVQQDAGPLGRGGDRDLLRLGIGRLRFCGAQNVHEHWLEPLLQQRPQDRRALDPSRF